MQRTQCCVDLYLGPLYRAEIEEKVVSLSVPISISIGTRDKISKKKFGGSRNILLPSRYAAKRTAANSDPHSTLDKRSMVCARRLQFLIR